jgi:NADPH:quinone reductase-like Zn-dependent oxidoreductase
MATSFPISGLRLHSLIKKGGELEVSLARVDVLPPAPNEVVVRIEATPINPSDLGLLFGPADMSTVRQAGTIESPNIRADVPPGAMAAIEARLDQPLPVGNEGAGTVVAAGSSEAAHALLGKTVALVGGGMSGAARRRDGGGWSVVFHQSAHGAWHGRNHAPRRPYGIGPHSRCLEPRPDAQ